MKKTGPPSVEASCDELKTHIADNKFVMVHFGQDGTEDRAKHVAFAQRNDKLRFFHNSDAACASEYGVATPSEITFFRQFEEKQLAYPGEGELEGWSKGLMVPTVFSFTEDMIEHIFDDQKPVLFLFRDEKDADSAF